MWTRRRRLAFHAAALAVAGVLAGCALGERAKSAYLQQTRVQRTLANAIVAIEVDRPVLAERLYGIEDELLAACAPLSEAGSRRFSGQDIDPDLEWAIVGALDACEKKTAQVDRLVRGGQFSAPFPSIPLQDAALDKGRD